MIELLEALLRLYRERGDSRYGGEAVSQREHALQAALFAEREGADPALVAAALVHDLGHLLHALPDDAPDRGLDDRHEQLAARWLSPCFGHEVTEPVRLHVAAKRYLCATEPAYLDQLSGPSRISLQLQGGPMTRDEQVAFESAPHFRAAVQLRRWDDAAKMVALPTPPIEHYLPYLEQARIP